MCESLANALHFQDVVWLYSRVCVCVCVQSHNNALTHLLVPRLSGRPEHCHPLVGVHSPERAPEGLAAAQEVADLVVGPGSDGGRKLRLERDKNTTVYRL